ncbi:MAG: dynamin family protein [Lentihominibacter sp.]
MEILELTRKIQETLRGCELCRLQADEVARLADKLENKSVTIAVIGQFKRGKTTMINSILGRKLLPTGIVPITAAVTRIKYGAGEMGEKACVCYTNGLREEVPADNLHKYISEQENRNNERGVAEVRIQIECDFLKEGLVLVDTPGVGSVHENNSKSAYDFVRESDGVVFMLSVDSPVNEIEVDFLKRVRRYAGKFYFTVNKVDTVEDEELEEYMEYCSTLLSSIMGILPEDDDAKAVKLIPISARKNTGIDKLTEMIKNDLLQCSEEIMERSVALKLLEIINNTRAQIGSYREVLKMAPNVFNRRFEEMNDILAEERKRAAAIPETSGEGSPAGYLRAGLNEEKALMSERVKKLFGIEYYCTGDRENAAELLSPGEYAAELNEMFDELSDTLHAIFMYKEENAYTVARRIEDMNILVHEMDRFRRQIETSMV